MCVHLFVCRIINVLLTRIFSPATLRFNLICFVSFHSIPFWQRQCARHTHSPRIWSRISLTSSHNRTYFQSINSLNTVMHTFAPLLMQCKHGKIHNDIHLCFAVPEFRFAKKFLRLSLTNRMFGIKAPVNPNDGYHLG